MKRMNFCMKENRYKNILGSRIKISNAEKCGNIYTGYYEKDNKNQYIYLLSEETDDVEIIAVIYDPVKKTEKYVAAKSGVRIYEPYIREKIGNIADCECYCLYEKTCGSIVYKIKDNKKYYLLIENDSGHIGFPKGHIEYGEREEETAVREVREETGLNISINSSTRQEYTYTTSAGIIKNCVYFYSEFKEENITLQQEEISQSWLLPYNEAYNMLNYPQDKIILKKAENMYD